MIQVKCAVVPPKAAAAAEEKAAAAPPPPTLPESESGPAPAESESESEETEVVFRSPLPDIEIEDHLLLHDYCLLARLPEHRDRPCLIDGISGNTVTYADVAAAAQAVAQGLARQGLRDGAVVMLLLSNSMEFVVSFLGASMAGCVATTANPSCTAADMAKQATASNCRLVITTAACVPKLAGLAGVKVVTVDEPPAGAATACLRFADLVAGDEDTVVPPARHVDDTVALPFSSGTTGLPKGVMLTHRSLVTSVAQQVDGANPNLHLAPADVVLCVLPLFHIYSLNSVLLCSLRVGAAVLLLPKFEMGRLLSCVQKHRVSVAAVVPPIVVAMAKSSVADDYDLSSVRVVLSGAAPLGPELEHALRRRLPNALFGQGYGMTEAGPVLAMCTSFAKEPLPAKSGSCGCVVRNAQMKIVDLDSGKSLPRNRPGEICIRGKQIMKGYLKDPEATARTIDVEGWLHTGDVGYVDDDGEVFIVDRVKEIIKFKGFQVPPAELEALLLGHSSVKDAAVVPLRDEAAGELPVAYVVKAEGADNLTEDELKQFVANEVVYYKRIHRVLFTQSIPKSPAGKILRRELRDKLNSCPPPAPAPAPAPVDSNSKK